MKLKIKAFPASSGITRGVRQVLPGAFTLIEIMVWILIFSIVIVAWFQAFSSLMIWKVKLIEKTSIEKEAFYFTEKFFQMIKEWWTIDYEEYFNRKIVWTNYSSWHYAPESWFGNFWPDWVTGSNGYWMWFYVCRSNDWVLMWSGWCVNNFNTWALWANYSYSWSQRYWQYSLQFLDYNSYWSSNLWDENWDGNIMWDDWDEWLWEWPSVFTGGILMKDLYLISWSRTKRTYFRWNVINDPIWWWCDFTTTPEIPTWTWCLWNIQFLKLDWKDWWLDHSSWSVDLDGTQYDGIIDTWAIDPDFALWSEIIADSNNSSYWQNIFPDTINIKDVQFYVYPNKSLEYSWMDSSEETNLSPYIRISLKLSSWQKVSRKIKWKKPEIDIKTTITLTDVFSN